MVLPKLNVGIIKTSSVYVRVDLMGWMSDLNSLTLINCDYIISYFDLVS